jgi:tRNA (mo5U34)-methyltransferase
MRQILKTITKRLPPIKRLIEQRDAFAGQVQALQQMVLQRDSLSQEVAYLKSVIKRMTHRSWRGRPLTPAEIVDYQKRMQAIIWWHSFDLEHGLVARGACTPEALAERLECLCFPENMAGQTFLDICAWDGFYAFEAEQRGAARVLATDSLCWNGTGENKRGFLLVREILGSKVEDMHIDPLELCPERVGKFDIVLFSGVLYHMRDPYTALERAASVTARTLLMETAVGLDHMSESVVKYIPRVRGNEVSNFWRPNPACVILWLQEMGFRHITHRILSPTSEDARGFFTAER